MIGFSWIKSILGRRRLFVDVSEIVMNDAGTGIQRVVRNLLDDLLSIAPYKVIPVRWTQGRWVYCSDPSTIVSCRRREIVLGLDLQIIDPELKSKAVEYFRKKGARVFFVVYDLIPALHPAFFPPGAQPAFADWLDLVLQSDGALCISNATASELSAWRASRRPSSPLQIRTFPLGSDFDSAQPTTGRPPNAREIVARMGGATTFIVVGTFEPRKAHAEVMSAFEVLWSEGVQVNLVLVGRQGWMTGMDRFRNHPERGKRLTLCEFASDEWLAVLYDSATCLIAASYAEGFGLPIIEAFRNGLPVIARDIGVFREVAGDNAFYFSDDLAGAIRTWLRLFREGSHPRAAGVATVTWRESAEVLLREMASMG